MNAVLALGSVSFARAAGYTETIDVFKKAGISAEFFRHAYAYAVFPTIAKGGLMYAATLAGQKYSHKPRGADQ